MSRAAHKKGAPQAVSVGILTVSTSRTLKTDQSGRWIGKRAKKEGHTVVCHQVVPDDTQAIVRTVLEVIRTSAPRVLLLTGGTGISPKDLTIEAVRPLFDKEISAFGPLFSQLSFEQIDSAALLSRATAGVIAKTLVFCMPGSLAACKLACKALIFPEIGHMVKHLNEGCPPPTNP